MNCHVDFKKEGCSGSRYYSEFPVPSLSPRKRTFNSLDNPIHIRESLGVKFFPSSNSFTTILIFQRSFENYDIAIVDSLLDQQGFFLYFLRYIRAKRGQFRVTLFHPIITISWSPVVIHN